MLKKMLRRAAVSAPVCMLINQLVGIVRSLAAGDGRYSPFTPAFAARFGSDTAAAIVQLLLIGLVGAMFAACSVIFEIDHWSFLKQGLVHLAVTSAVALPVCLYCWFPETRAGAATLIAGYLFTYVATWLIQYLIYRKQVRALDAKIKARNREEEEV